MSSQLSDLIAAGFRHQQAGHMQRALDLYQQVLDQDPLNVEAMTNTAVALTKGGAIERGLHYFRIVAMLQPSAETCGNYASALRAHGCYQEAWLYYDNALKFDPRNISALWGKSTVLEGLGHVREALECLTALITLNPADINNLKYLGAFHFRQGNFHEGYLCFHKMMEANPSDTVSQSNAAIMLHSNGQTAEAVDLLRQCLSTEPNDPEFNTSIGKMLMMLGRLEEGHKHYRWRWKSDAMKHATRGFAAREWRGENVTGKTVLIYGEQGFGDSLHYCRYVPMVAALGARVVLDVPEPLVRLMTTLKGIDKVIASGQPLPYFDYCIAVMDLPDIFKTRVETIPAATPYLFAHPADIAEWQKNLVLAGQTKKVGLAWAGNPRLQHPYDISPLDRRRSVPIEQLASIVTLPGLTFYGLQKWHGAIPAGMPIIDLMPLCHDFADTAALISQLDLVVTVDSSIVHLAGALGKPVWLLNRSDTCWRWFDKREDSPWYPTLRIFRQKQPNDWRDVLHALKMALDAFSGQNREIPTGAAAFQPNIS